MELSLNHSEISWSVDLLVIISSVPECMIGINTF